MWEAEKEGKHVGVEGASESRMLASERSFKKEGEIERERASSNLSCFSSDTF